MTHVTHPCVEIQTDEFSHPSIPSWFAETVLIATALRNQGRLSALAEHARLTWGRFGHYEVIDFLAVLFAYAVSGERTLEAFFARAQSVAAPLMALFERDQMPHRSTVSRFLAAITPACLDALRQQFAQASYCWGWTSETIGGIWDRTGAHSLVFDIDGTREAARQRKLLDLIRFYGHEKLGILPASRGKYATPTTNVYERVQRRSRAACSNEREEHEPGGARSRHLR